MDATTVMELISNYGFSIVMCLLMAWYIKEQNSTYRQDINALNEQHNEEMLTFTEALNNNTLALTKLTEKIG